MVQRQMSEEEIAIVRTFIFVSYFGLASVIPEDHPLHIKFDMSDEAWEIFAAFRYAAEKSLKEIVEKNNWGPPPVIAYYDRQNNLKEFDFKKFYYEAYECYNDKVTAATKTMN